MNVLVICFKGARYVFRKVVRRMDYVLSYILFSLNGVHFSTFRTSGIPFVMVARGGRMSIGKNFAMNNSVRGNPIGCYERCTFFIDRGCTLTIGENVGISQTALITHADLVIEDNVKIGGGSCIYTSDFHSLDVELRSSKEDLKHRKCAPVVIEHDAFIGARCIVLKGVTIGACSIIGAGSVVTKSVVSSQF